MARNDTSRAATAARNVTRAAGRAAMANPWVAGLVGLLLLGMVALVGIPLVSAFQSASYQANRSGNLAAVAASAAVTDGVPADALPDLRRAADREGIDWALLAAVAKSSGASLSADSAANLKALAPLAEAVRRGADKAGVDRSVSLVSGARVSSDGSVTWDSDAAHQADVVGPWTKALAASGLPGASESWAQQVVSMAVSWELGQRSSACGVAPAAGGDLSAVAGDGTFGSIDKADPAALATLAGLKPNGKLVVQAVAAKFPAITTVYGVRTGDDAQDHALGLGVDVMIDQYRTPAGRALGQQVADYLKAHHRELGIHYLMWNHQIWNVDRDAEGWRNVADRGGDTANHLDHVHVSLNEGTAPGIAGAPAASAAPSAPAASAAPTGPATTAASAAPSAGAVPATIEPNRKYLTIVSTSGEKLEVDGRRLRNVAAVVKVIEQNKARFGGDAQAQRAMVIATATMAVEANMLNVASIHVPESAKYPNDGYIPADLDSIGLFQQRARSGAWGTVPQIMDPATSAGMFLGLGAYGRAPGYARGLLQVDRWTERPIGEVAQAVQVSAFPDRYQKWADAVLPVIKMASGVDVAASGLVPDTGCAGGQAGAGGPVVPGANGAAGVDTYLPVFRAAGGGPGMDLGADPWSFFWGECVSYVAYMVRTATPHKDFHNNDWLYHGRNTVHFGNAKEWVIGARNGGIPIDQTPAVGAVAVRSGGRSGHVAFIVAVNPDGSFVVNEYNHRGHHVFSSRTVKSVGGSTGDGFDNIIHFEKP